MLGMIQDFPKHTSTNPLISYNAIFTKELFLSLAYSYFIL